MPKRRLNRKKRKELNKYLKAVSAVDPSRKQFKKPKARRKEVRRYSKYGW